MAVRAASFRELGEVARAASPSPQFGFPLGGVHGGAAVFLGVLGHFLYQQSRPREHAAIQRREIIVSGNELEPPWLAHGGSDRSALGSDDKLFWHERMAQSGIKK